MKDKALEFNPNSGEFIYEELLKSRSNLDHRHEISFWLYFPSRELADHPISTTRFRNILQKEIGL